MKISKLTTNGRLTIPADIRNRYDIKPGTHVHFVDENDGIKIIPITNKTIFKNVGFLNTNGALLKSLMQEKKIEREL